MRNMKQIITKMILLMFTMVVLTGSAMADAMIEVNGKQGLIPSASLTLQVEDRLKPLPSGAVKLNDKLGQLVDQCINRRILGLPQGWEQFVVPFEKGDDEGWAAEFWGKWATSVFLAQQYRPSNTNIMDIYRQSFNRIIATQKPDGYMGTFTSPDLYFTVWDVWCRKYTMHGLLAYHDLTQNAKALSALTRLTDNLMAHIGPGKQPFSKGPHHGMAGATILEPVVLTYRKTGQVKYLDYANLLQDFVLPTIKKHSASHLSGHAYVHMSLCEGLLELYRVTGNRDLLDTVLEYYKTALEQEILAVGSGSNAENWWGVKKGKTAVVTQDEPDFGFFKIETCATVTWIKLNYQLLRLTGESRFVDEIEKTMYNIFFRSINWDDGNYGAWMPIHKKNTKWFVGKYQWGTDVGCCAANGPRALLLLPRLAVMRDAEGPLVNLYTSGNARVPLSQGGEVMLTTTTEYPVGNIVTIAVKPEQPCEFTIKLRIPSWSVKNGITVNGSNAGVTIVPSSYVSLKRVWKSGDIIQLALDVRGRIISAPSGSGNQAVMRGPLLLSFSDASVKKIGTSQIPTDETGRVNIAPAKSTQGTWTAFSVPFVSSDDGKIFSVAMFDYATVGNAHLWSPKLTEAVGSKSNVPVPVLIESDHGTTKQKEKETQEALDYAEQMQALDK